MGWYPASKPDVMWGDDAFMETHKYLEALCEAYMEGVGRRPTREELESVLAQAIRSRGEDETFSDGQDQALSAVAIKLVKRKPKQPAQVGDIFCVQIELGEYAFARIISLEDSWKLAEVLSKTSKNPTLTPEIAASPALYPPVSFHLPDITGWKIRIVGQSESSEVPYLPRLEFVEGMPGRYYAVHVGSFDKGRSLTDEEAKTLPTRSLHALERMVKEVKKILARGTTVEAWLGSGKAAASPKTKKR